MKTRSLFIVLGVLFIMSCKKTENSNLVNLVDPKLKSISLTNDTITPLCIGCQPTISQQVEHYSYDNSGNLISRVLTKTTFSNTPVTTDTLVVYSYYYSGARISQYTRQKNNISTRHVVQYDAQNRVVLDSIINPSPGDDKITSFRYLPDTVIQTHRMSLGIYSVTSIDTLVLNNGNVVKEIVKTVYSNGVIFHNEFVYVLSAYRNPLSYVNNFSLLSSDHKNGMDFQLFPILNPQNVTYNAAFLCNKNALKNGSSTTAATYIYNIIPDSAGRVKTLVSVDDRKSWTYGYY